MTTWPVAGLAMALSFTVGPVACICQEEGGGPGHRHGAGGIRTVPLGAAPAQPSDPGALSLAGHDARLRRGRMGSNSTFVPNGADRRPGRFRFTTVSGAADDRLLISQASAPRARSSSNRR